MNISEGDTFDFPYVTGRHFHELILKLPPETVYGWLIFCSCAVAAGADILCFGRWLLMNDRKPKAIHTLHNSYFCT